jgi:hypothetical protein
LTKGPNPRRSHRRTSLLPVTFALVITGAVAGTEGRTTVKLEGEENGPHAAWQARTFSS